MADILRDWLSYAVKRELGYPLLFFRPAALVAPRVQIVKGTLASHGDIAVCEVADKCKKIEANIKLDGLTMKRRNLIDLDGGVFELKDYSFQFRPHRGFILVVSELNYICGVNKFPLYSQNENVNDQYKELINSLQEQPTSKDNRTELIKLIDIPYEIQQSLDSLPGWGLASKKLDCKTSISKEAEITKANRNMLDYNKIDEANTINDIEPKSLSTPPSQTEQTKLLEQVVRTPKEPATAEPSTSLEQTMSGTPIEYYLEIIRKEEQPGKEQAETSIKNRQNEKLNDITENIDACKTNANVIHETQQQEHTLRRQQVQDSSANVQSSKNSYSSSNEHNANKALSIESFFNSMNKADLNDESEGNSDISDSSSYDTDLCYGIATQSQQQAAQQYDTSPFQSFDLQPPVPAHYQDSLATSQKAIEYNSKQFEQNISIDKTVQHEKSENGNNDIELTKNKLLQQQQQIDIDSCTIFEKQGSKNVQIKTIPATTTTAKRSQPSIAKSANQLAALAQLCPEQIDDADMLDLSFSSLIKNTPLKSPVKQRKIDKDVRINDEKRAHENTLFVVPKQKQENTNDRDERNTKCNKRDNEMTQQMWLEYFNEENKKIDWGKPNPLFSVYDNEQNI